MLSVSSTLAAAIDGLMRWTKPSVVVDWSGDGTAGSFDDLSNAVTSLVVDRAITTDLPAEANIVEGDAAGQATIALGPDLNGVSPAQMLSPYTAHLAGGRRVGAPVTVAFRFKGAAGWESVPALTGKARTGATSDDGTATLTVLDGPELLRTAVTLPVFVAIDPLTADRSPGLSAGWVIDYILRANGFFNSPPKRADARVSATLHGSVYPETGTLVRAGADIAGVSYQGPPSFTELGQGTALTSPRTSGASSVDSFVYWSPADSVSVDSGASILVELARLKMPTPAATLSLLSFIGTSTGISLSVTAAGALRCGLTRGGVTATVDLGVVPNNTEGYLAVHFAMTDTGATVNVRIGAVTSSGSIVVGTPTGNAPLTSNYFDTTAGAVFSVSGYQLTTEAYSASMWNDAFVPTAVLQPSLNELGAMPAVEERMPWPLLQEIVEAEQGVILFDENGVVRFYNRNHMTGGTAVAVMRAVKELTGVSASETIDSVRNIVRVPAAPLKVDPTNVIVWAGSETLLAPASGTLIVPAQFDGQAVSLDTSFAYYSGDITAAAGSGYRAARNSDGTGGDISNLSITVAQYPARLVMFIANPNAFDVWLVNNSLDTGVEPDIAGRPLLQIVGRLARAPENPYTSRATDSGSIGTYGEQPLDVPENIWRQSVAAAENLSAALLTMLKEPHAVLNGVEVVGDPRRQLADRLTLIDTNGIGWARDVWLLGITSRQDSAGFTQSVAVREAGSATRGMTGTFIWDVSYWDSLDGWVA